MATAANIAGQLIRAYNLQNVRMVKALPNNYEGKIDQTSYQDKALYQSTLGTPVLTDLTLEGVTYTGSNGQTVTVPSVKLVTVLMAVSLPKNIVSTAIQGRDGTVKEYIGKGDYQITINGILTGQNGHYPVDEVIALKRLIDAPVPIRVTSSYLQHLDIYNIVVADFNTAQEPGGYSQQIFTINAISDTPIELLITNV
ncbi:DUF6046 domain-containing protein [Chitinophaga sp. 22536]|uniref:DUF6046 domain-containing protein n=1 Tax=unclassified Chitinophaga TaxID=2619133 RepID=UPI003F8706D3